MASKLVMIVLLAVGLVIGIGIAMFILPSLLPMLDEQTRIIIGIVLSLFSFISLYFMTKSHS